MKLTTEELLALLNDCPRHHTIWRHYKTKQLYKVVGCAIAEATQEPVVIYQRYENSGNVKFTRPLSEWGELTDDNTPRFTLAHTYI